MKTGGVLAVYRLQDGGFEPYHRPPATRGSGAARPLAKLIRLHEPELVLVRRADRPLASLVVLRYHRLTSLWMSTCETSTLHRAGLSLPM